MVKQAWLRGAALVALLVGWVGLVPGAGAQTQPYPYPQGYYPTDPNAQYYNQYYGQYNYGSYQPYGNSGIYGPSYSPYGYGYGPYGGQGAYNAPYAYQGYGTALNPYYGAPPAAPGYYGTNPAYPPANYYGAAPTYPPANYYGAAGAPYPPPNYYGAAPPPYPGQGYYDPNQLPPPLGLPYGAPAGGGTPGFVLTATLAAPNLATLNWSALPGAVSYAIYTGVNGGPLQFASTSSATQASVPLNQGSYVFAVHALANGGSDIAVSNVASPMPGPAPSAAVTSSLPTGPGMPSPQNSTVASSMQSGSLFFGTQITVTVRDIGNVPVSGQFVSLSSSRGGDSITPANGTSPVTNQSGQVFFAVRPSQPGQATFSAFVGGLQVGQTLVNFQ